MREEQLRGADRAHLQIVDRADAGPAQLLDRDRGQREVVAAACVRIVGEMRMDLRTDLVAAAPGARPDGRPDAQAPTLTFSDDKPGPKEEAYEFDGEYWNDELQELRFSLVNRCREASTP